MSACVSSGWIFGHLHMKNLMGYQLKYKTNKPNITCGSEWVMLPPAWLSPEVAVARCQILGSVIRGRDCSGRAANVAAGSAAGRWTSWWRRSREVISLEDHYKSW